MPDTVNLWSDPEHALRYLEVADTIPHRTEGERVLLEFLPERVEHFVDLGCGDGRLTALVLAARPDATAVGFDFGDLMLEKARRRFADDPRVEIRHHDLDEPLPDLGAPDAIVSSFAIHHVVDDRKRALFTEAFAALRPGGMFLNLEHVAADSTDLHHRFLAHFDIAPEDDDPSNKCAPVADQTEWLRAAGFVDVGCHWKWTELALLAGARAV